MSKKPNMIKKLLFDNGDTYKTLAGIIGCKSVTTVHLKVNGKRKWTREELIKVKEHYNLSNDDFVSIFFN